MDTAKQFSNFTMSIAAAGQLLTRAHKTGSFLESICLSASIIDGLLRMGLILEHQLDTGSDDILPDLLYQSADDKIVFEKEVYRRAHRAQIINDELLELLFDLYADRNRVVHRFIISDIKTSEVLQIASRYFDAMHAVNGEVATLEKEQIARGVGMTRDRAEPTKIVDLDEQINSKHGDPILARNLRRDL